MLRGSETMTTTTKTRPVAVPPVNLQTLPPRFPPTDDDGMWTLADIAKISGVTINAIWQWRKNTLAATRGELAWERHPRRTLPIADNQAQIDAGETTEVKYRPETIIPWLQLVGRCDAAPGYELLTPHSRKGVVPMRMQMDQIAGYLRDRGLAVEGETTADTVSRLLDTYVPARPGRN